MILEIFKDAIEYSFKDKKLLLKLGVLKLLSFLIFPLFLLLGYSRRVMHTGLNGMINSNDPVPPLNNWGGMFVDGLKTALVIFAYSLPGFIVFCLMGS
ncbi:MAG: DUF4013 domain-containing protein, partial [Methanobrevibacter sp.]|nr:DUF4013 domain-containing protein [Methanobrevibacter sp.]